MKPFYKIAACTMLLLNTTAEVSAQAVRNVQFTINAAPANRKAISPLVYGTNDPYPYALSSRLGGNRLTNYNWENNASNAGRDWFHQSDNWVPGTQDVPPDQYDVTGSALTAFQNRTLQQGGYGIVTLPMAGYVAKDKNSTITEAESAPSARWAQVIARKPGGQLSLTPDVNDNAVYVDEELNFLITNYGRSNTTRGVKAYSLDNEPCLWFDTHPRLWGHTGVSVNYLMNKSYETAELIKEMDPTAEVYGPALWGYTAYQNLQFAPDWDQVRGNYELFVHYYLANMRARSQQAGKRLLDVLDLHWYPAQNRDFGGMSPFDDYNDDNSVGARLDMSRGLWDDTYQENSWVTDASNGNIFPALPKMKAMINQFYPGTKLAITEYSYGGTSHVSGVIAQADALGAFGTNDVYLATYWGGIIGYIKSGFDLYCNYDGNGGRYGNTAVSAQTNNRAISSVYASINATGDEKMHTMAINRSMRDTVVATINVSGARAYRSAAVYAVDWTSPQVRRLQDIRGITNNSFEVKLPPMTVYHLVLSETDLTVYPYITNLRINPAQGYSDGTAQFTISATITDSDGDMRPPTVNLSSVGGNAAAQLTRNGDNYTLQYTVPLNTPSGLKTLTVSAVDAAGHSISGDVSYRVMREIPSSVIWDGDVIQTGEGERFSDPNDQTAGTQRIERRTDGGNEAPSSLYLRFKHDVNNWGLMTWRIDPSAAGARDVREYGYLEFYIRSNAPAYADIDFSLRDASANMTFSRTLPLKASGYISSFHPTRYTKVKIPFDDLFVGTGFDLSALWQLNFQVNTAQDGFEVWIDDVRAIPHDNPISQPVVSDVRITPAEGFADGLTPITLSVIATDPNNDLATVTADLSSVGGANKHALILTNGRYTTTFTIPPVAAAGNHTFRITATDQKSNSAEASAKYYVWSRASSDVLWDGDTKNEGVAEASSNPESRIFVAQTGGNKGPISMRAHLQPGPEPYAYVTWDFAEFRDARMIDVRQKRYLNFSVLVPNGGGRQDFDLQIYFKDRFGESTQSLGLKARGYITSYTGNYQNVRIPIADLLNNSPIDASKIAWMGLLSERLPTLGTHVQLDDIYLSGTPVADVQIESQPSACGNNGRIEVKSITSTSGNYRYSLAGGAFQASPVFANLAAGTYDLRIEGDGGFVYVETIVLSGGTGMQLALQVDNAAGNVNLTVTGGSGNYTYRWSNNATVEDLTNVVTGAYTVTVTDATTGCTATGTATVTRAAQVTFQVKDAQCFPNGMITVNVAAGTGNLRYFINGVINPGGAGNNVFNQLNPGTYTMRVTGDGGLDFSQDVTVGGNLNTMVIQNTVNHHHGNIDITMSGGSGNYRYLWSTGSRGQDLQGQPSGRYHLEVTDFDTKCVTAIDFVITRTGPDVTTVATDADCEANGTITVNMTGASAAPYQFYLNGIANPSGIGERVYRNLAPDMYDIRITGANGYEKTMTVFVDGWVSDVVVTSQINQQLGSIDVTVAGGTGPFSYLWSNNATTQDVTGLASGDYWVDVTDNGSGCVRRQTFRISRTANPTITYTVTDAACGANGRILTNLSEGTPAAFSYFINNQENPAGVHTPEFRNLAPGTYSIRVTGDGGFTNTQNVVVAGSLNTLQIIGAADEDGNINITVHGGTGSYQYLWSDKSTTEDLYQRPPGTYTVRVTDNGSGCTAQFTILVAASRETLWVYPNPAQEGFRVKYVIPAGNEMELTVTDLFGRVQFRKILTAEQGNEYVPAARLNSGLYFVTVKSGKHKQMRPVIIAK